MRTTTLLLVGAMSVFAMPAFADGSNPCSTQKIYASGTDQMDLVNCYIDASADALRSARLEIQAETPADKAGSDARWEAMAAIDAQITALEALKIAEGTYIDIRVTDEEPNG